MNKEQEKIFSFYKEFWSWKAENIGMWIGAGILEFLFGIFMMIPYAEMQSDMGMIVLPMLMGFGGGAMYIAPYITFREGQDTVSIYEKIKYLPIDYREVKKLRVKKLVLFVAKIFAVILAFKLFFSTYGTEWIRSIDIIYTILVGLVWPIVSNLPYAWFSK
ncbi:MAG: hypothetical protein IKL06_02775 [Lachnospiraceae bacterium]|nr:hypothetical protein [Lachnospiraceae bacterium]